MPVRPILRGHLCLNPGDLRRDVDEEDGLARRPMIDVMRSAEPALLDAMGSPEWEARSHATIFVAACIGKRGASIAATQKTR
jgi:hypothetical protein